MKVFTNNFLPYLLIFFFIVNFSAFALSPEKKLQDPELENRAMNLFLSIRCIVCNGQVIENSDTKFAFDMRELIRNQIQEGKNDDEIKKYLIDNFGDDILTEPNKISLFWFLLAPTLLSFIIFIMIFGQRITPQKK